MLNSVPLLSGVVSAFQGDTINLAPSEQFNSLSDVSLNKAIAWTLTVIIILAGVIFFFMLIFGGIQWITSGGDKVKTESARKKITAALVGLAITFSAWAIARIVSMVFDVNILDFAVPYLNDFK